VLRRRLVRVLVALSGVVLVTFVAYRVIPVNATTVGFAYLLLILIVASTSGFPEAALSSLLATLLFNFFFLPPVGTFTVADPQNWVSQVPDTVVVPASSVIAEDNGSTTVVTVKPDNTVVSQKVQVGIQQGDKVQIVSGLSAGEKVISSGGYGLPDGTKVQPSANNSPNPQNASKQPVP
jgi:hypothetical protein